MLPVVPVRVVRLGALCVLITVTVLTTSYLLLNRHHGIDDKLELLAFTDNGTAYAVHDTLTPSWTTEQLVPRFAYVQYATNLEYLCNALINFTLLRRYGAQHDLVLIHPEKWMQGTSRQAKAIRNLKEAHPEIQLRPFGVLSTTKGDSTWRDSLTKFHAFALTDYTRVLAFDSDTLVLNSMDHYFLAPLAAVAVPRAYWLTTAASPQDESEGEHEEQGGDSGSGSSISGSPKPTAKPKPKPKQAPSIAQQVLGSHVMLLEPDTKRYERIVDNAVTTGDFDMEVVNHLFADNAMILPHRRLALLTGEFRHAPDDHAAYLAPDTEEEWNAMAEVSRSYLVHFSDWPLPKPWKSRTQAQWDAALPACDENEPPRDDRPKCADRVMWTGFYDMYDQMKGEVCGVLTS
ncbi:hypothetical protein D7B24_003412 [Verticillium nonalfalfae]|uniref:N-acetylglucosaminyltransferase n=1 Tax=Verticillium nonalfalfae TaxID=1051616 RepID=A0A3M9XZF7_9PEZI|nr:uncharacterized protein D7B24_003412 [Verticillium nonalfalfae]RNJ52478.1 hypothetical protein D7B24_003412 [Verticillium nonalfalfae]